MATNFNVECNLRISDEQFESMRYFFSHHGWDWDSCLQSVTHDSSTSQNEELYVQADSVPNVAPIIPRNLNSNECPDCFSQPCVLDKSNEQSWWPNRTALPKKGNRALRRKLYKKFWTMLCHRGVWKDDRYVQRKLSAIARDRRHHHFVWLSNTHRRDLMPNCVIRQVRKWFPNLPGQEYVGHLWE